MSFDFSKFHTVASALKPNQLNQLQPNLYDEAVIRICISRIYYAAYHQIKSRFGYVPDPSADTSVHAGLLQHLKKCGKRHVARELEALRDLRVKADYVDTPVTVSELDDARDYYNNLSVHF